MENGVQLLSFFISFLYGIFFALVSRYHYKLVFSLKWVFRYILTFLFILDVSLFYILLLYYINQGVVHLYFLIITFLGYAFERYLFPIVKKYVKSCHFIEKHFHK